MYSNYRFTSLKKKQKNKTMKKKVSTANEWCVPVQPMVVTDRIWKKKWSATELP